MRDVCNVTHTLLHDRLQQHLMAITQAALTNGVAPPDMDSATVWLDEWLEREPEHVNRELEDWRAATGLRAVPVGAGG